MYSVDERTGVILPLSPASVASGNLGTFLTMDPSRNFAFVDDVGTNVYTYAINQLTGNLTQTAVTANGQIRIRLWWRTIAGSRTGQATARPQSISTLTMRLQVLSL